MFISTFERPNTFGRDRREILQPIQSGTGNILRMRFFSLCLLILGCTEPALNRYSRWLDPKVGNANKSDMVNLFGAPVSCRQEANFENCEFRTARGRNAPVPAVHQQNASMGPDLSPYEHFDVLSLQFDGLGVLRSWKPLHVQ